MAVVSESVRAADPVEASVESVVAAVDARLDRACRRDESVTLDFGERGRWVADLMTARLSADASPTRAVTAEVIVAPKIVARILNGMMEPRHAVLFGLMEVRGSLATAIRWFDELAGIRHSANHDYSPSDIPLPAPTRDLVLALRQLRVHGYCIVSGVLEPELLRSLRTRLVEQAAAEREIDVATRDGGVPLARGGTRKEWWMETPTETARPAQPNQRVWALQNKGDVFLELLDHPVIDALVPDLLGDHFLVAELSANIVGPGGEAMVLHQDQSPVQPPLPVAVGFNMMLCLDDFTVENGATLVVPGSHVAENGLAPDDIYSTDGTVAAVAPAGSAIVYDSRLWHGTGQNTTRDQLRHGLYILFFRS
jgi:phytanoyl-CoA dioxygenase PhyH